MNYSTIGSNFKKEVNNAFKKHLSLKASLEPV